ncbi:MAG TPA: peptidase M23, partial [Roseiflexaceae bacterium]
MRAEEAQQPGVAERAARHAASYAAQQIAQQALVKAGALLGAKGAAVVAAVMVIIALIMLLIVSVVGAAVQRTTAVWPVPVATDAAGNYLASGWMISSRYGWRDDPQGAGAEFHDGLDLANPQGVCP